MAELRAEGNVRGQDSSYRRGVVLGLTMAEIMLLLIFCLLIAMASSLRVEQTKRASAESDLRNERQIRDTNDAVATMLRQNPELVERIQKIAGTTESAALDQYWRELVESRGIVAEMEKQGLSSRDVREHILAAKETAHAPSIDIDKALRDAEVVGAIRQTMAAAGKPNATSKDIAETLQKGLASGGAQTGHQWPPIISLSEAGGYFFKTGSAELSVEFRQRLLQEIPQKILQDIQRYDVDVVEVVGHTDEQPIGARSSNLDRSLLSVVNNNSSISTLLPADNAGLGLARAVSVLSVLRQNPALAKYKLIPLSGAQLVNTDETLAMQGNSGDIPQRRRIEIRLRKFVPGDPGTAAIEMAVPTKPKPRLQKPPVVVPNPVPALAPPLNLMERLFPGNSR